MNELEKRILLAQIGSCACNTKTPVLKFHDESCTFRVLGEAQTEIEELEGKYATATAAVSQYIGRLESADAEIEGLKDRPTLQQVKDAVVDRAISRICDMEPDPPEAPATICVDVSILMQVLSDEIEALSTKPQGDDACDHDWETIGDELHCTYPDCQAVIKRDEQ